jgi:cardiolipin synthase
MKTADPPLRLPAMCLRRPRRCLRPMAALARWVGTTGLLALVLFGGACTALPKEQGLPAPLVILATPTVTNANGVLSEKKARSLLVNRWQNSHNSHIDLARLAALEEAVTGSPLISGNQITLLYDGPQTMAAMMQAIRTAKDNINLETYIFDQDPLGLAFAALLIERQKAGVQVQVIYDSVGTLGTPQVFFDNMAAAGIHLVAFNPVKPWQKIGAWLPNQRDHRKILLVDGLVAFTGGVNISNTYANSSLFRARAHRKAAVGWRDTHIKIEGPAVAALQWIFLNHWASQNAPIPDSQFFPPLHNVGDKLVRVLASEPDQPNDIYQAYILAIQQAKTSIHITSAYFVPGAAMLQALCDSAQRGVEVRLILPGVSDVGLVARSSESFYSEMLACGIQIHQMQIAVLHAKTAVIDQVWATVGSTNIDQRSFLLNHEINVVVFGHEFASAMEQAFKEDLRNALPITAEQWAKRGLLRRTKEWLARGLADWL